MNILILNYEYPPIGGGGGVVSKQLTKVYSDLGYKPIVITSKVKGLPFKEVKGNETIYRLFVFRKSFSTGKIYQMFFFLIFAFPLMLYILMKENIKFIHIHFLLPTGVLGLVAKKLFKIRYIVTLHGGDVPSHYPNVTAKYFKYLKYFAIKIIKNSEKCIAVSESLYQLAVKDFKAEKGKIAWIDNGVPLHKNMDIKLSEPMRFIFIGRLSSEKNILPIIKILAALKYNFKFDILGDGEQMSEMAQFLRAEKERRIELHGWIESKKISVFLKTAHFMIMNSKIEGLSMAALEAMSYGIPIISSDCEGMKRLVKDEKNGFLFRNEDEFKNILCNIFDLNFERNYSQMRNDTFEIVKRDYDIKNTAKLYLKKMNI